MRHRGQEMGFALLIGLLLVVPTTGDGTLPLWVDANGLEDGVTHFRTISAALQKAAHQLGYRTLWVAPGGYRESLSLEVVGVRLQSTDGPEKTKIFGSIAVLTKNVFVIGFSVRPLTSAPALSIKGHRAFVSRVTVQGAPSGGIVIEDADDVILDEIAAHENAVGIKIASGRGAQIVHSRVSANTSGVLVVGPASDCSIVFERNAEGGVLIDNSVRIDLYKNDFRENGAFDLRVAEGVHEIVARRNFWGTDAEPSPREGLEFDAIFPWLLRPAEPNAGRGTAGWFLEAITGGEQLDAAEQNSLALTLSPQARGTRAWVIAQALSRQPEGLPILERGIKYFAVRASGIEWVSLPSQRLADERAVTGTVSPKVLEQGALIALAASSGSLMAQTVPPKILSSDPPVVKPVLSPAPPALEPDVHTWKFSKKIAAKGVIARLLDLLVALFQCDWGRAWHEWLGLFATPTAQPAQTIQHTEKIKSHRGGASP